MPLGKDTTFKVIGKDFLKLFLEILGFEIDIDYSQMEELTGELILLEGEVKKPDAIFSDNKVILMLEYQSKKKSKPKTKNASKCMLVSGTFRKMMMTKK